jgi:DNA helicase-2/ATP-dependent DNA helicase PcrA
MKKLVLKPAVLGPSGRAYRIPYQQVLNEQQYRAVMHSSGPALVLAGAGTGKTRTLTYRVARLVEDGVDPASILLLTFTRKAAGEMIRRASALLDGRCEHVAGGTFHAFAWTTLRRFGIPGREDAAPPVQILDQSDAQDVMNIVRARSEGIRKRKRFANKATLHDMYSKAVNTSKPLSDVIAEQFPQFVDDQEEISEIIRRYNRYKHENGLFDYDDLLLYLLSATRDERIGPVLRSQFRHVMVDEYQDTNNLQHQIIAGLVGSNGNLMVVGDDAQSIYSFRGSNVRNIHLVPEMFHPCEIIRLEQNYRSTQQILDLCNSVIDGAPGMFDKRLHSTVPSGEPPMLVSSVNERQQSQFVIQQILDVREAGVPLSEIAVLVRSGFLSFDLEIELQKANIPFRKFGGLRFAEAAHVKDLIARLRLTENPRDMVSWHRVLVQLEGVGQKTAEQVIDALLQHADPLGLTEQSYGVSPKAASSVSNMIALLQRARTIPRPQDRCSVIAEAYHSILQSIYDDAPKRWKDIETILAIASRYGSVAEFLADIALEPPTDALDSIDPDDAEQEFVTLSTIHSAKGLEWNTVFLLWVNEGRIPSARSAENEESLEEERRLLYVAMTRAKRRLYLTYPAIMLEWQHTDVLGKPSRFLDEVSREVLPQFYLQEDTESSIPELPA